MRHRFHAICPYFAMFPEVFVRKHLVWSKPGDLVLDPFSGRGTTAFESILNGRAAIAMDINPVAICVSRAKTYAPYKEEAIERLVALRQSCPDETALLESDEFFSLCFHRTTLRQLVHLRQHLDWMNNQVDCFLAALCLGCLHGESHRSHRYFSNRMPRTISTKPGYSVRWWKSKGCCPLGGVDGFDKDEAKDKGNNGAVVLGCLLAAEGDALEALELAHKLLDASAGPVERLRKEPWPGSGR